MIDKEQLIDILKDYFSINDDCYAYNLVRSKESIGDEPLDLTDFQEFDSETIEDIAEFILMNYEDGL